MLIRCIRLLQLQWSNFTDYYTAWNLECAYMHVCNGCSSCLYQNTPKNNRPRTHLRTTTHVNISYMCCAMTLLYLDMSRCRISSKGPMTRCRIKGVCGHVRTGTR